MCRCAGPGAVFLEKEPEGNAGDVQRARRDGRRKADVPRRLERRRGIIPASGFFEGTDEADGTQPHLFTVADGSPILAFAGLWDRWIDPASKEEILSCTIIVSGASEWMTPYHDRMPVLLRAEDFDAWLNGSLGTDALRPAAESALREWPVSRRVNRAGVGEDDPTIIERVGAA